MSATGSDAFGRCVWCGSMTDEVGCLNLTCATRTPPPADPVGEPDAWGVRASGAWCGLIHETEADADAWLAGAIQSFPAFYSHGRVIPLFRHPAPEVTEAMMAHALHKNRLPHGYDLRGLAESLTAALRGGK